MRSLLLLTILKTLTVRQDAISINASSSKVSIYKPGIHNKGQVCTSTENETQLQFKKTCADPRRKAKILTMRYA